MARRWHTVLVKSVAMSSVSRSSMVMARRIVRRKEEAWMQWGEGGTRSVWDPRPQPINTPGLRRYFSAFPMGHALGRTHTGAFTPPPPRTRLARARVPPQRNWSF